MTRVAVRPRRPGVPPTCPCGVRLGNARLVSSLRCARTHRGGRRGVLLGSTVVLRETCQRGQAPGFYRSVSLA